MWGCISTCAWQSLLDIEKFHQSHGHSLGPESSQSGSGTTVAISNWKHRGTGHSDSPGLTQGQTNPIPPLPFVESEPGSSQQKDSYIPVSQNTPTVVVCARKSDERVTLEAPPFTYCLFTDLSNKFTVVVRLSISIHTRLIPGKMNVIANNLSRARQILPVQWSLHQDIFSHVFNQWGHPSLGLFVTRFNTKCH